MTKKRISNISAIHYFKLIFRSALFLCAAIVYIVNRVKATGETFGGIEDSPWILAVIWSVFVVEIFLRFFPSKIESMGCQKQFEKNFIPTSESDPRLQTLKTTLLVALVWILLNAAIGAVYFIGWIDRGILLLISLAFSVCDMICILFFCPFQTWFMKNKCCTSCRIYNWDYAMVFTPLVFIADPFAWSILLFAIALLVRWEIAVRRHPERFSERTNACLSCSNCKEKLCHHKKQLQGFLKHYKKVLKLTGNALFEKIKQSKNQDNSSSSEDRPE